MLPGEGGGGVRGVLVLGRGTCLRPDKHRIRGRIKNEKSSYNAALRRPGALSRRLRRGRNRGDRSRERARKRGDRSRERAAAEETAPADEPEGESLLETAKTFEGAPVEDLIAAIGEPESSDYAPSCLGEGEDGNLYYDGFTVYTTATPTAPRPSAMSSNPY